MQGTLMYNKIIPPNIRQFAAKLKSVFYQFKKVQRLIGE